MQEIKTNINTIATSVDKVNWMPESIPAVIYSAESEDGFVAVVSLLGKEFSRVELDKVCEMLKFFEKMNEV